MNAGPLLVAAVAAMLQTSGEPKFDAPIAFAELPGAASGSNIWFATADPERDRRSLVHHHATDREESIVRVAAVLDGAVEAMAAHGDRVWVVLAPRVGSTPRREVVTMQTARNPVSNLDYSWPREGPTLLPSLPGEGRLMAFAAGPDGPVALIWPSPLRSERVRRGEAETAVPQLHRLDRQGRWIVEPLPVAEGLTPWSRLVPIADGRLGLLASRDGADSCLIVPLPEPSGIPDTKVGQIWTVSEGDLVGATLATGRPLAVMRLAFGRIDLAYPRGEAMLELAGLDSPRGRWRIDGTADGIRYLHQDEGRFVIRSVDPIDGRIGDPRTLEAPSFGAGAWLHLPLLGMLTVTAILALVLFRPIAEQSRPRVPEGAAPLAWWPRLAALAIDVLPGAVLAMVWFETSPAEFALLPAWSLDLDSALPSTAAVGITVVWCLAWELILGRTPGKMLVSGRVVAVEGGRPGVWRTIVRNLFKGVLLYAPVLAIFTALNPFGQGIGETLSRTLVLGPAREWSPPEANQGD